ncbi:hypothetical protein Tco_0970358 [Tanacetum coccineum]
MAGLELCSKHNMVAYLEKTDGNTEFHQIMDFLTRSSINYALTVSPIVSTLFVEQFWTTAKSRTVNNTKASIRSDLLFNDADGIDSLNNQAIFDNIQLMGPSPSIAVPDSNPKGFGGNHGGQSSNESSLSGNEDGLTLQSVYDLCVSLCKQVTAQDKELKALKAQVKKLTKGVKPLITHHKAWMKTRLARKTYLKKKGVHKEYVSKQGKKSIKSVKGEPSVHKDPAFDDLDDFVDVDDTLEYMKTVDDQNEGRTSSVVLEEKESADKEVSTKALEGTADLNEGKSATQTAPTPTSTPTPTIFETERPRPTSTRSILTLRPLPKMDPKDKGKKRIEEKDESDTESKGITEAEKKFKQLANDEEVARKARLNADKILAEKLQEEERDMSDDSFVAIGSAEDEKMIKEINEQAADASKKRVKKDDSVKREIKEEKGTRKRKECKKRKFTSKDDEELRLCLTIAPDEDKEVDYEILDKKYPIIEWRSKYLTTKPQYDETEEVEDVYPNVVIRSNRQRRYFSTLMAVLSILDRDGICAI